MSDYLTFLKVKQIVSAAVTTSCLAFDCNFYSFCTPGEIIWRYCCAFGFQNVSLKERMFPRWHKKLTFPFHSSLVNKNHYKDGFYPLKYMFSGEKSSIIPMKLLKIKNLGTQQVNEVSCVEDNQWAQLVTGKMEMVCNNQLLFNSKYSDVDTYPWLQSSHMVTTTLNKESWIICSANIRCNATSEPISGDSIRSQMSSYLLDIQPV